MAEQRDSFPMRMRGASGSCRGYVLGVAGLAAAAVGAPGAALVVPPTQAPIQAHFTLISPSVGTMNFSTLVGISSNVLPVETTFTDKSGKVVHTKQFGKNRPPTVALKRTLNQASSKLFAWHQKVRKSGAAAQEDATLKIVDAQGETILTFLLIKAFPIDVSVPALPAGSTAPLQVEITLQCEEIIRT